VKNCSAPPFSASLPTSLAKHGQLNEPCSRKKRSWRSTLGVLHST
jgi:hypothetical protein